MTPGATVYVQHPPKKGKLPVWCRATVCEVHGAVVRLTVWTGSEFVQANAMMKNLRAEKP